MTDPHVRFAGYIARERLKMTPQRRHILEIFLTQKGHVTAEELYETVKARQKGIGQATVYRALKLFSGAGIARQVDFGDGVARYEHQPGDGHHDHLICEVCGANEEILDETIEKHQEEVAARHGYRLTRHKMSLYGVCPRCQVSQ